ncbi:putative GDSL esterase/lipase [Iris pallida]|uniref:GDSL esterase/lipase n=1 Tax=Iris pallida TaxID=29817 RepID=A0AAX6GVQ5_IRIPA|nr:putative GDSL esterase/lipase [Iris pallida]
MTMVISTLRPKPAHTQIKMASFSLVLSFAILLSGLGPALASNCYESLISFGDSITDTGNLFHLSGGNPRGGSGQPPYGETYFHRSTGRFSDGRLIIDFIAEALGLPLVLPYAGGAKQSGDGFKYGVNFAVGGATALDSGASNKMGLLVINGYSMKVQMGWFKKLLPSLCASASECKDMLGKSLLLVGEIGGNDYYDALMQRKTLDELHDLVPNVVSVIGSTITELIGMGARTIVVPGNFPVGCSPALLTSFQNSSGSDYDTSTGCIKWLNEFAEYQNSKLQEELHSLREQHPSATIIYADYYNATMSIFRSPASFGFRKEEVLKACCGGGGPNNYNLTLQCSDSRAKVCDDPSEYVSWDGVHMTEAAYKTISNNLLAGHLAMPIVNNTCPRIAQKIGVDQQTSGVGVGFLATRDVTVWFILSFSILCILL